MSDPGWGDMLDPYDEEPPFDVGEDDEPRDGAEPAAEPFTPDIEAVLAAEAQVSAARRAVAAAEDKLAAAEDAHADAEDEVSVAETKAAEYADDADKKEWQRAAAQRDVSKRTRASARAAAAVSKAQAAVQEARLGLAEAEAQLQYARSTPAPPEPEEPTLYYGSVDEFLREFLRKVYTRRIDGKGQGNVWAAEWWKSREAVHRLEALWRAWEHLRLDAATGMSVWWRDHADHHMPILMSSEGPFRGSVGPDDHCFPDKGEFLPYANPPEGLFPDVREPVDAEPADEAQG